MNVERTASNLIGQLPNRQEILAALGLEARRSISADAIQALGYVGVGVLIGGGLALLLAPKSGRELRDDVRERVIQALPTHSGGDAPNAAIPSPAGSARQ